MGQIGYLAMRGSQRSSGFHWNYGLRYFLIPLATGVMIFGTGYAKEEWRRYCLEGRKRRRSAIVTDFDDPLYAPAPVPQKPDSASIPSILKKKKKKKGEDGRKKGLLKCNICVY
ncbi:hypothetical protein C0J52_21083 [Blattella germanica]|nr:hypothetical protein C0J52_21083 [Blattella germanica]